MINNVNKIHVFSVIPYISSLLQKRLPTVSVFNVVNKDNKPVPKEWNKRVISQDELIEIKDAEIILGDENLIAQVYQKLNCVKFVQCTWAGVEVLTKQIKKEKIIPVYPVLRLGSQIFSQYMAEYVVGQILMKERNWLTCHKYQVQKIWGHQYRVGSYRSLREITVGVLGVGTIGFEVARTMNFFGSTILGLGRKKTPPKSDILDNYYSTAELPSFLEKCDYIINILPSTPSTQGLLGNDILSSTKKCPTLINVGRGDVIPEDEIIKALDNSWISSAILDVFETEPLPSSSRLWSHPKVFITPHVGVVTKTEDIVSCFLDNLNRYRNGDQLKNVVNWNAGY